MSPENLGEKGPDEIRHLENAPISPHLRWIEIYSRCVIELIRLKQKAKILAAANPDDPNIFHGFEQETLRDMGKIVCEGLGWRVTHNANLPIAEPDDRFVYFGNHPTLTAVWAFGAFLQKHFAPNIVAVGKKEIIDNRLSRWALGDLMLTARKGIFIDRKNRENAKEQIREQAVSILTPGTGAVIFPDEHRAYKRRISRQQIEWDRKRPDLSVPEWMTDTCFPKSGGLWNFAQVIEGLEGARFLDCTTVEPSSVYKYGGEFHMDIQEISREELLGSPESEEHLRAKLVELWKRKNEMIRNHRNP